MTDFERVKAETIDAPTRKSPKVGQSKLISAASDKDYDAEIPALVRHFRAERGKSTIALTTTTLRVAGKDDDDGIVKTVVSNCKFVRMLVGVGWCLVLLCFGLSLSQKESGELYHGIAEIKARDLPTPRI